MKFSIYNEFVLNFTFTHWPTAVDQHRSITADSLYSLPLTYIRLIWNVRFYNVFLLFCCASNLKILYLCNCRVFFWLLPVAELSFVGIGRDAERALFRFAVVASVRRFRRRLLLGGLQVIRFNYTMRFRANHFGIWSAEVRNRFSVRTSTMDVHWYVNAFPLTHPVALWKMFNRGKYAENCWKIKSIQNPQIALLLHTRILLACGEGGLGLFDGLWILILLHYPSTTPLLMLSAVRFNF